MPPRKRSGPATGPLRKVPPEVTTGIVPDPFGIRLAARERISQLDRQRRIASQLEELASLATYYSTRWWRRVA
jgi:hypothetical protein